ncbi:MAG: hypothetical protein AAF211_00765, partial [Myxococcota bacterium]
AAGDDATGPDTGCAVETIDLCSDPSLCTSGTAPNGDTTYSYTLTGDNHPLADDAEATCFLGTPGADLVIEVDATDFLFMTASTCSSLDDASIAVFDGDPTAGGMPLELTCTEDSATSACADTVVDVPVGATSLFVLVDEFDPGSYWDSATTRTIDVALTPSIIDITGCPAGQCTSVAAAGGNGGDLDTYTITGPDHPSTNDIEGSCFGGSPSNDLIIEVDVTGYTAITGNTCNTPAFARDSSMTILLSNPDLGPTTELVCDEDSGAGFCAQVGAAGGGVPIPVALPPGQTAVWVVIDEWNAGDFWDGSSAQEIEIEKIP